jgi:hypothetical protein
MTRQYQTAEGTARVHTYAGDYVIQVKTTAGTRRDFVAWHNKSAYTGRAWCLMTAPGQGSDVLRDDLPTLRAAAEEAIGLVAWFGGDAAALAARWPHADDPTRVDSLGREHDDLRSPIERADSAALEAEWFGGDAPVTDEHDPARNVAFGLPAEWVTREHADGARFTASPATHDAYEREVVGYLSRA